MRLGFTDRAHLSQRGCRLLWPRLDSGIQKSDEITEDGSKSRDREPHHPRTEGKAHQRVEQRSKPQGAGSHQQTSSTECDSQSTAAVPDPPGEQ